jgi:hypothetical protein
MYRNVLFYKDGGISVNIYMHINIKYDRQAEAPVLSGIQPFCSRTPRYNFSSTLYPQSCWYIMQVIGYILYNLRAP